MLVSRFLSKIPKKNASSKLFHCDSKLDKDFEHPFWRTLRILGQDIIKRKPKTVDDANQLMVQECPSHVDIAIIGGGAMGSSIAYWLKEKTTETALNIVVIERDMTYKHCTTALSCGGLRQQFSLPENVMLSLYGAEFMRTLKQRFGPEADVNFTPNGYLLLASASGAEQLIENSKMQNELGAVNKIFTKEKLKERFPWINTEGIEVGCLGLEKEGWFDPWSFLHTLKKGAISKGTQYINAEVVDFGFEERRDIVVQGVHAHGYEVLNELTLKFPNGETKPMKFACCVIAAGSESGKIGKMAGIGSGEGILSIPIPVERRKRYVYSFSCQKDPPGLNTPLTIDTDGTYFRREGLGGAFIGGLSPTPEEEPEIETLEVDHEFWNNQVWPNLAHRVPAFNAVKVNSSWAGFYDYNYYDQNGIIGPHSHYHNLFIATGFSGHGIQQAPAVGRAVAELILDGGYQTIDLTRLGFDRLVVDKPMYEVGIF